MLQTIGGQCLQRFEQYARGTLTPIPLGKSWAHGDRRVYGQVFRASNWHEVCEGAKDGKVFLTR